MPEATYIPLDGSNNRSCNFWRSLTGLEKILIILSVALAVFVFALTMALVNCKATPDVTTVAPHSTSTEPTSSSSSSEPTSSTSTATPDTSSSKSTEPTSSTSTATPGTSSSTSTEPTSSTTSTTTSPQTPPTISPSPKSIPLPSTINQTQH